MTLTAGAVAASGSASASTVSQKRAEAAAVQAQIQQAQSSLERQIEAYNNTKDHYEATKAQRDRARELLGVAKANLARSEKNLAASLTQAYKSGGNDDLAYLLASDSFADLIDNVSVLEKAANANGQLVTTIAKYKKQVSTQEATLATATAKLHQDVEEMAQRKQAIESQIASLHSREAQISSQIKQLIREEQARQNAAANAAAAAATGGSSTTSTGGGDIPIPPSGTLGGQAVGIAMQYLGTPYVWGGASPGGFDCSGLTMYVYSRLGVSLPHNAAAQYGMGVAVPRSALEPGDLVFFDGLGHVGIYVGNNAFIHAPHTGDVVRVSSLSGWYSSTYVGARRVG
jgi:peptidoglycan DL-endopeptidase CwlO